MKKTIFTALLFSLFSANVTATIPSGNDTTTKPDLYYLTNAQAIDSLELLPPPPKSAVFYFYMIKLCMKKVFY